VKLTGHQIEVWRFRYLTVAILNAPKGFGTNEFHLSSKGRKPLLAPSVGFEVPVSIKALTTPCGRRGLKGVDMAGNGFFSSIDDESGKANWVDWLRAGPDTESLPNGFAGAVAEMGGYERVAGLVPGTKSFKGLMIPYFFETFRT
jgi:hypothetical protein